MNAYDKSPNPRIKRAWDNRSGKFLWSVVEGRTSGFMPKETSFQKMMLAVHHCRKLNDKEDKENKGLAK